MPLALRLVDCTLYCSIVNPALHQSQCSSFLYSDWLVAADVIVKAHAANVIHVHQAIPLQLVCHSFIEFPHNCPGNHLENEGHCCPPECPAHEEGDEVVRQAALSRDSILPPSVCACSTSGARSTNTITPCCISTCTTHDRSLANCLMCSLDRATTCIVCLISHISFTYLYVRVLHLTVCMCQLRPRIRFRCHTLSHAFQCGRIAPAVLALNTTPTVTKR
jgi:hypothetical protein